jgi:hypothetical protein
MDMLQQRCLYPSPVKLPASEAEGWNVPNANIEAKWLYAMVVRRVETVESIRELIAVPPNVESALRGYARRNPNEACRIERVLQFRSMVQDKFKQVAMRTGSIMDSDLPRTEV